MAECHDLGGTIRARTTEQTLKAIQPYIKKAGITRLADLTGLDNIGIPVYTCIRPNSKIIATSQGKGITDDLAICSAYMEAIEHYFVENIKPDMTASLTAIRSQNTSFISLERFANGLFYRKLQEDEVLQWSLGKNLLNGKPYYVPTEIISFDLTDSTNAGFYIKETTGIAAGNHEEEAQCHSLYEIIERCCLYDFDRLTLTEKNKLAVDLKTIDYPHAVYLLEKLKASQVDVTIFDITNRFGVPAFYSIICDNNPLRCLGRYSGSGAHLNRGVALCRAITEAIQSRLTYISGSRDDMFPDDYQIVAKKIELTASHSYTLIPSYDALSLAQQKELLLTLLAKNGITEVVSLTHTEPHDAIAVVHTLIPQLNTIAHL